MVAGGFNQNPQQAQSFFQGYQLGWQRFQQTIVSDPRFMQELRVTDLSVLLNREPVAPPVGPPVAQQQSMPPPASPPHPAMMTQGAGLGSGFGPPPFPYGVVPSGPIWPQNQQVPNVAPDPVIQAPIAPAPSEPQTQELITKRENEEKERVRNMTTPKESPLKIEEITAAASPVDVPNGPVSLGSVMGPGFIPRSQRGTKTDDSGNNGSEH